MNDENRHRMLMDLALLPEEDVMRPQYRSLLVSLAVNSFIVVFLALTLLALAGVVH